MRPAKNPELTIRLSVEGSPTENGHVLLDDFVRQLRALEDALASVDREINGRTTLDYRVVDLKHSSPATVGVEPILKEQYRNTTAPSKYRNSPEVVHHRFFNDLKSIRATKRPPGTREETFDALRQLVDDLGKGFSKGAISNSAAQIPLDAEMFAAFEALSKPSSQSIGSVVGELLTISFARANRFYIYPRVGPTSVACHFDEVLEQKAKACIRKMVRVHGRKLYRPSTGLPFRIDVDSIEELRIPKRFVSLGTRKTIYKGEPADVQIAESRNEWKD